MVSRDVLGGEQLVLLGGVCGAVGVVEVVVVVLLQLAAVIGSVLEVEKGYVLMV